MTETEFSLSFPHFAGKFSIGENRSARGKNAHHIGLFGFSTFYTETTSYYFYLFFLFYILLRESRKNFKGTHARRVEKVGTNLLLFSYNVLFACPKRTKRTKRGTLSSFELFLSPRGDQCEQSAPTVRQLLNHGYRFETLKRRLGFTAVPCQAMANLAVGVWVRVWVRT